MAGVPVQWTPALQKQTAGEALTLIGAVIYAVSYIPQIIEIAEYPQAAAGFSTSFLAMNIAAATIMAIGTGLVTPKSWPIVMLSAWAATNFLGYLIVKVTLTSEQRSRPLPETLKD
jgi:hypothetical protein